MDESNGSQHPIQGSSADAVAWIEASSLSERDRSDLLRFVSRFPSLVYTKESDARLNRREAIDGVKLPPWLRDLRKVFAFVDPPMRVRFDDFDRLCPRSDDVDEAIYTLEMGYANDEARALFKGHAGAYPIGDWREAGYSHLAIDLLDPTDERIFEFAREDLHDNVLNGISARASMYPVFRSYCQMMAHIVAGELPDGTILRARALPHD